MKRIIFIILLILPFVSCNDFLEEVPKDKLSEMNFYSTLAEAEATVTAIYYPIRTNFKETYISQTEIPADYAYGRGSTYPNGGDYIGLSEANINAVGSNWANFYQAINYANIAIEKIPLIEANESNKNALVAEAHFLRAFCYYILVRRWGAVPLRLKINEGDIGRTPVADVYESIISDLKIGEEDLPSTSAIYGRSTKWAAKTLLSEVYLTMGNWSLAAQKAKEVIDSGLFGLVEVATANDFDKIFGAAANGTKEEIFYLKYSHENGTKWPYYMAYTGVTFTNHAGYVVYSDPENPFMKEWSKSDLRKQWGVFTEYVNASGVLKQLPSSYPMCFSKYRDTGAPNKDNHANDYHALRYADVLFIYAEAANMENNGPTSLAVECLNKIKRRGYGYSLNSSSPVDYSKTGWTVQSFRDSVLQERAYEFICEGKRWLDLLRTGTAQEAVLKNKGKTVNECMLLWPIPKDEINTNPLINQEDQNPGY